MSAAHDGRSVTATTGDCENRPRELGRVHPSASNRLRAVSLPAGAAFLRALDDAWDAGDAVLPLAHDLPAAAAEAICAALRPHVLVDGDGVHPLKGGVAVEPGVAAVVATSGSTGAPKGVELTHAALAASADATIARLGLDERDVWLCCLPVSHVAGLVVLLRARRAGGEVIMHARFDTDGVAAARGATVVSLVPTQLHRLLAAGADLARFRWILLGGAAPPPELLKRAAAAGARLVVTYGMTETCGGCVYDGIPLDGVEVDTDVDGHIRIRGATRFARYRLDDAGTAAAIGSSGWFLSGDLGGWDAAGRLMVTGRSDDVIITGGENVTAGEVAAVLATHPAVAQVAVVGRADFEWGQRVVAVVVPAGTPPTLEALRDWVGQRLPRSHAPSELVLADVLPLLPGGKLDRRALAASDPPSLSV
ncbi:MAG: AMP-binding protein [Euzebyales bacterium]|nr:AMP-binding protein [Euzebyales bacterium]